MLCTTTATKPPKLTLHLFKASDILSNPSLNSSLTQFINHVFSDVELDPEVFDLSVRRLPTTSSLTEELGPDAIMATLVEEAETKITNVNATMPAPMAQKVWKFAACASLVPWHGDFNGMGTDESGWEIKTVCVEPNPLGSYRKQGLPAKCIGALEEYLRQSGEGKGKRLQFWIQAVEMVSTEYWRRRGFEEVRRAVQPPGLGLSKKEFDLMVLRKVVEDG